MIDGQHDFTFLYHYLHFPVRGRKLDSGVDPLQLTCDHYLHFPVRGRKLGSQIHNSHNN